MYLIFYDTQVEYLRDILNVSPVETKKAIISELEGFVKKYSPNAGTENDKN